MADPIKITILREDGTMPTLDAVQQVMFEVALENFSNLEQIAQAFEMSRTAVQDRLKKYGLETPKRMRMRLRREQEAAELKAKRRSRHRKY